MESTSIKGQAAFDFAAPPDLSRLEIAEHELLRLADYVYGHTPLKPMSKTLFFISRCLVATAGGEEPATGAALAKLYEQRRNSLPIRLDDDFSFRAIVGECERYLPTILKAVSNVRRVGSGTDPLGLAFNTLLRGKWEVGEGLGTYLTPEEIVVAMVRMSLGAVGPALARNVGAQGDSLLYGDICGGTGRFVYRMAQELEALGLSRNRIAAAARLYDQSSLAVDFARVNFVLNELYPTFERVDDSLTAGAISSEQGKFLILATNPPFGAGKYRWSERLGKTMPPALLSAVGMSSQGDTVDPAALFLVRNLTLLADGGVLAIVLPDGLLHSSTVRSALMAYEETYKTTVDVVAIVSLPTATFSLGGTVAKTSFVIVQKTPTSSGKGIYFAEARHIGFLKRGNRRVADPSGNDLEAIAGAFAAGQGQQLRHWRNYERLAPGTLLRVPHAGGGQPLRTLAEALRRRARHLGGEQERAFHVSILDVDETGFIDLLGAARNRPASEGLQCEPGDIIVSCINPRIWRVAVIPDLPGTWSCSPEFLVLRPRVRADCWKLGVRMHQPAFVDAVRSMAGGTSSSRQRVQKEDVLDVVVPELGLDGVVVREHARRREECYRIRLSELAIFEKLLAE